MKAAWMVFRKELVDALRDRRTLLTVFISSVAMGPLMLLMISSLVSNLEAQAAQRIVMAVGLEHAPSLRNYFERQSMTIEAAPADYLRKLQDSKLGQPVLKVAPGFEAALEAGESPEVEVFSASGNQRAEVAAGRLMKLLQGFGQEQVLLRVAVRGLSPQLLQTIDVQERDASNPAGRAAQLTAMLPFFVIMAVLYGALNAALDATAGERERGSLEPLLMNPASRLALVVGKWGAVAALAMLIAVLSSLSFLPSQWLLRSEALAAMFQYGWPEALRFLALLTPLAGLSAALLMAVAIRCKSFKEAQASGTVVLLAISLSPMMMMFGQQGEQPWFLWVPGLAQAVLMNRVLKGEAVPMGDVATSAAACVVLGLMCLAYVASRLRHAALK